MIRNHKKQYLAEIPTDRIMPNRENPRLNFRQGELDQLQESIRIYGIKVPISVYKNGKNYILIDGERRWRCASKLNRATVPALVQDRPSDLENLLLMFNIHSLREQWDLLTIALKLPSVISLYESEHGNPPTEAQLAIATGMTRSVIRRCHLLLNLPQKYRTMLLEELKLPKSKQRLSEDLFIEMERALKTVSRFVPQAIRNWNQTRDVIIKKYRSGVIGNIVDLRMIPKIARSLELGVSKQTVERNLEKLFTDNRFSIADAFSGQMLEAYSEKDILSRIEGLIERFRDVRSDTIDSDVRDKLKELIRGARKLLEESS